MCVAVRIIGLVGRQARQQQHERHIIWQNILKIHSNSVIDLCD